MKSEPRLTVEFGDASSVDEYRIRRREVEFRPRCRDGFNTPKRRRTWTQLNAEDIAMHLALNTAVGEWLMLRLFRSDKEITHTRRVA
jgi:hypothetical protein